MTNTTPTKKNTKKASPNEQAPAPAPVRGSMPGVITFEPVSAPMSTKRAADGDDSKPRFSLYTQDRTLWVYGQADVDRYGVTEQASRVAAMSRYTDPRYLQMLMVQWLHLFPSKRTTGKTFSPLFLLSVPISVYNNDKLISRMREAIIGTHTIDDAQGCTMHIKIEGNRFKFVPESTGAFYHYACDPYTLELRHHSAGNLMGNVLVADVGMLTADYSVYREFNYLPSHSHTEPNIGMLSVVNAVRDSIQASGSGIGITDADTALMYIADIAAGAPKWIVYANGSYRADVAPVYDQAAYLLANSVADKIKEKYEGPKLGLSMILLAGGGAYHIEKYIRNMVSADVDVVPEPALANVLGTYSKLSRMLIGEGRSDEDWMCIDAGNGGYKGCSSETMTAAAAALRRSGLR